MSLKKFSFFSVIASATFLSTLPAYSFDTKARAAILMEASTGKILFEKDAYTPIPPASMSKLMTVYLVMEALHTKRITEDTEFVISRNARRQIGSRMFLEEGKKVRAIDLLRGAIIQS